MKILIVNNSDIAGGAARAANRLHQGLMQIGLNSQMFVLRKISDDNTVLSATNKFGKTVSKARSILDALPAKKHKRKTEIIFSAAWLPFSGVVEKINNIDPDIVHLHWINGGMIKIEDLKQIKRPIVWSLHDMWPFTGGCHYDGQCGKYKYQCGSCPILNSKKNDDLSRHVFKRKLETYANINNLIVVGLSSWLKNCAIESRLFTGRKVFNIPNPIDLSIYKPLDYFSARVGLNLPDNKKLILFGAMNALDDTRKGFDKFYSALKHINSNNIEIVVFGSNRPHKEPSLKFPVNYLGCLNDDFTLRMLYSAVDLMVVPSLQENLSNIIMESLACGTPVVAFKIGGNADMILHKQNGYLAQPYDPIDLASGIDWVLNYSDPTILRNNSLLKVQESFELSKVAGQYYSLYKEIISS